MTNLFKEQFKILEPDLYLKLLSFFEKKQLRKGEYLLNRNEISDKLYFLKSGFVREYENDETNTDNELDLEQRILTNWIIGPNVWFNQITSFITEKPSECYLQALSQVTVYSITKNKFIELIANHPVLNLHMHQLQEAYLLKLEQRNKLFRIKNLAKKLAFFEQLQPELANQIP